MVRSSAWLLAAAVAFATLGPPGLRPHSDLGQDGEHALAFVLVGLAFGLAYPRRRLSTTAIAVVLIGLLELMQFWAPGRHARLDRCRHHMHRLRAGGHRRLGHDAVSRKFGPDESRPRGVTLRGALLLEAHAPIDQSMILTTRRVRGSTITRRSFTTA